MKFYNPCLEDLPACEPVLDSISNRLGALAEPEITFVLIMAFLHPTDRRKSYKNGVCSWFQIVYNCIYTFITTLIRYAYLLKVHFIYPI